MAENGTFVFVTLHVGHVFWLGHFDVRGGAVVLLERRLISVEGFFTFDCGSGDNSQRESFDGNGGTWVLLEHRHFAVRGPRRHRPRLGLRPLEGDLRRVRRHGVAAGASTLSSLQALFLWRVLVHRRDDVHRFGGTRVPGNAEEHTRVVDEVDGKSVGLNGTLAHWACHRQAQLGLFLSTWLSALT